MKEHMNIVAISASPRRHGNSETLLDHALAGAISAGAKTEKIILSLLDIRPCHGSDACLKKAECFVKDDMPQVLDKIAKADSIIIASPVYFGSVTAQLKAMIDRCQPLWVEKYILKKKRSVQKKGVFLCVSSYNEREFFRNSKEIVDIFFKVIDAVMFKSLYFPGLESKNIAKSKKQLLEKAFKCGKKLAQC
jgi:multimeric flavodoxin WrbA